MKLRKRGGRERRKPATKSANTRRSKRGKKSKDDVWYHDVPPIFEEPISDDFLGLVPDIEGAAGHHDQPSVQVAVERSSGPIEYPPAQEVGRESAETGAVAQEDEPGPAPAWTDDAQAETGYAAAASLKRRHEVTGWPEQEPGSEPTQASGTAASPAGVDAPIADRSGLPAGSVSPGDAATPEAAPWPATEPPPEQAFQAPGDDESEAPPAAELAPQRPFLHDTGASPEVEPPMIIPIRAYYMTRADDTLRSISAQFLNTPSRWQELRSLNAAYPGVANAGTRHAVAGRQLDRAARRPASLGQTRPRVPVDAGGEVPLHRLGAGTHT